MYREIFNLLPERMRKPTTERLYYVLFGDRSEIYKALRNIEDSRDIDRATGQTLDLIGSNVGQYRQGESDDLYRLLIKTRIIANLSIGDIPTINQVLSVVIRDIFIGIQEVWGQEAYKEPAAIRVQVDGGLTGIPMEIVSRVKAAAIRVLFEVINSTGVTIETSHMEYLYRYVFSGETYAGYYPEQMHKGINLSTTIGVETSDYGDELRPDYTGEISTRGSR